jgi:hypothetical protein
VGGPDAASRKHAMRTLIGLSRSFFTLLRKDMCEDLFEAVSRIRRYFQRIVVFRFRSTALEASGMTRSSIGIFSKSAIMRSV